MANSNGPNTSAETESRDSEKQAPMSSIAMEVLGRSRESRNGLLESTNSYYRQRRKETSESQSEPTTESGTS